MGEPLGFLRDCSRAPLLLVVADERRISQGWSAKGICWLLSCRPLGEATGHPCIGWNLGLAELLVLLLISPGRGGEGEGLTGGLSEEGRAGPFPGGAL